MENKDLREIVKRIKEAVSIDKLIIEDGIKLTKKGKELVGSHSFKHKTIKHASLSVSPEKGLYYCFSCGEGGDHFVWLRETRGYYFESALEYLCNLCNLTYQGINSTEIEQFAGEMVAQGKIRKLFTKVADVYHGELGDEEYQYLSENWGLDEETVKKYKIGFAPNKENFIMQKMISLGFPVSHIKISGLLNYKGCDHFQGRIIFPYWKNNEVTYFIGRRTDKTPDTPRETAKYKKLLTNSDRNPHVTDIVKNNHFVGENSLWNHNKVIITEGVTDCYAANQHGFASISPATVIFKHDDFPRLLKLTRNMDTVYICNDSESSKAGEKGALKTAEFLESNDVTVKLISLPLPEGQEKIDLAEYLRDHGKDSFLELMQEAKSLLEIDFDFLDNDVNDKARLDSILSRLASIKSNIEREQWIQKLKEKTGIGVTAIRKDVGKFIKETRAREKVESESEIKNQADMLIQFAKEKAQLFHDELDSGFARLQVHDHEETWEINGERFRNWLIKQYFDLTGKSPNSDAIRQAINTINAISIFDGEQHNLFLRVAQHEGHFWYDLADERWQSIEVSPDGWEVVDKPPILFRKYTNTAPQVMPVLTDSCNLDLLDKYFNLKNKEDLVLMYASVASFLIPEMPHPIIIFYGDKGSAKTTAMRIIRKLIDPAHIDTACFPRNKDDLTIMLQHNYAPSFDNLDGLKDYQSDILCQAVTGGGTSKRKNYTDTDEIILRFKRCIMLNGINLVASRDDLLDRSVIIRLDRISKDDRKEEAVFWKEFEAERPLILGSLLNIIAKAMVIYPNIKLDNLPRMADFARWGYALTEAMGKSGDQFLNNYYENIATANEEAVLENMVSATIMEFMENINHWEGTATELLKVLTDLESVNETSKKWPKTPQSLSRELNLMSSALEDQGIGITRYRDGKNKILTIDRKA